MQILQKYKNKLIIVEHYNFKERLATRGNVYVTFFRRTNQNFDSIFSN